MQTKFLFLLGLALAPTSVLGLYKFKKVPEGQTSCRAEDDTGEGAYYTVEIGVPYDATKCKNVGQALIANFERAGHDQFKVTCHPRRNKQQTEMLFQVGMGNSGLINPILRAYFTEVNGFNCPDY